MEKGHFLLVVAADPLSPPGCSEAMCSLSVLWTLSKSLCVWSLGIVVSQDTVKTFCGYSLTRGWAESGPGRLPLLILPGRARDSDQQFSLCVSARGQGYTTWGLACFFHLCFSRDLNKVSGSSALLQKEWLLGGPRLYSHGTSKVSVKLERQFAYFVFPIFPFGKVRWLRLSVSWEAVKIKIGKEEFWGQGEALEWSRVRWHSLNIVVVVIKSCKLLVETPVHWEEISDIWKIIIVFLWSNHWSDAHRNIL